MVEASITTPKLRDQCGFGAVHEIMEKLNTERNGKLNPHVIEIEKILFSCRVMKFNRFNMK